MKKVYIVDKQKDKEEKNIFWGDCSTFTLDSLGRKRPGKSLHHYYDSWEEYAEKVIDTHLDLLIEYALWEISDAEQLNDSALKLIARENLQKVLPRLNLNERR